MGGCDALTVCRALFYLPGMIPSVEWKGDRLRLLDQRRLPTATVYIDCVDAERVTQAISELSVRGAPAIGIAAAYGVALAARGIDASNFDDFLKQLTPHCDRLASARPTAVNLRGAVDRMKRVILAHRMAPLDLLFDTLLAEAQALHREDREINLAIGVAGADWIRAGDGILTHCNTGSLATGGYGTALGVIRSAWAAGKKIRVFVGETRPVLQGARLTMWELREAGIPATLITDGMAAHFMRRGDIQCCIVGADRIAANGDVANKIGTYSLAVLAKAHGIPFYVAAPLATIDMATPTGDTIPIEERDPAEITHIGGVPIAPSGVTVANPAFDVTPAAYVTAIVTEKGVVAPHQIGTLYDEV